MKRRLLVKNARLLRGGVWESGSMLAEIRLPTSPS